MASKKQSAKRTRKAPVVGPSIQVVTEVKGVVADAVALEKAIAKVAKPVLPKAQKTMSDAIALVAHVLSWADAPNQPTQVAVARGFLLAVVLWCVGALCSSWIVMGPVGLVCFAVTVALTWAARTAL